MNILNISLVLVLCSFAIALPHPPPIGNEDVPPDGHCNRNHQCPAAADGRKYSYINIDNKKIKNIYIYKYI